MLMMLILSKFSVKTESLIKIKMIFFFVPKIDFNTSYLCLAFLGSRDIILRNG